MEVNIFAVVTGVVLGLSVQAVLSGKKEGKKPLESISEQKFNLLKAVGYTALFSLAINYFL